MENVIVDPQGSKKRLFQIFEKEDQALACTKSVEIYTCDLCRKKLLRGSIPGMAVYFCRKGLTLDNLLQMVNYNVGLQIPLQH